MMAWDEALARCERELDIQRAARDAAEAERDEAKGRLAHYEGEAHGRLRNERDRLAAALREMMSSYIALAAQRERGATGDPMFWDGPLCARQALSVLDRETPDSA